MKHSHAFRPLWRSSTIIPTMLLAAGSALAQSDNFDDGNDAGWTRYDPLGGLGAGPRVEFTFPNGGYRISALVSPAPGAAGPARGGSFRTDVSYSNFYMSVDIISWDFSKNQAIGLFGRARELGLGTTDGYVFNYNPRQSVVEGVPQGQVQINRVVNEEAQATIASFNVTLDPTQNDYRFVFRGNGNTLTGEIFTVADSSTPVVQITAEDGMWPEGFCGIFVYDRSSAANDTAVATFDNYVAAAAEPPPPQADPPTLSGLQVIGGELRFGFAAQAGFSYQVQKADTLPAEPLEWTPLATFPAEETPGVKSGALPLTGAAGYVRVVSPAPPTATAP
jgi:hypothetical protein